jgi:hypothetical protein
MVTGFGCETVAADMGMATNMSDASPADGGMSEGDNGLGPILAIDGGSADGGTQSGGGSSGGCQVDAGQSHLPLFFLLILMGLYPLTHRRTRR